MKSRIKHTVVLLAVLTMTLLASLSAMSQSIQVTGGKVSPLVKDSWAEIKPSPARHIRVYNNLCDSSVFMCIDLGIVAKSPVSEIKIQNRQDVASGYNTGKASIYVSSYEDEPGFDPANRDSYDIQVLNGGSPLPVVNTEKAWRTLKLTTPAKKRYFAVEVTDTLVGRITNARTENDYVDFGDIDLGFVDAGSPSNSGNQYFKGLISNLPYLQIKSEKAVYSNLPASSKHSESADIRLENITVSPIKFGKNNLTISLVNTSTAPKNIRLSGRFADYKPTNISETLKAGETKSFDIICRTEKIGNTKLQVSLKSDGREVFNGAYDVTVPNPIAGVLNEYAYPSGTEKALWTADIDNSLIADKSLSLELFISKLGDNTKRVGNREMQKFEPKLSAAFDIKDLPVGRYKLHSHIVRQGKAVLQHEEDFIVFKKAPTETWEPVVRTEVRGDTIYMNGKPFLGRTLACMGSSPSDAEFRDYGYNLVTTCGDLPDPTVGNKQMLDECARVGKWGMVALFVPEKWWYDGTSIKLDRIRDAVLKFKDHPALWGWNLADEPDLFKIPPSELQKAKELIHELDPNHIVWINVSPLIPDTCDQFNDGLDLWAYDYYPLPMPNGLLAFKNWLTASDTKIRGKKPMGTWLQTFNPNEFLMPSPDMLRAETWLHAIHGYKFYGYFCYGTSYFAPGAMPRDAKLWSSTRALNSEMISFSQLILGESEFKPIASNIKTEAFEAAEKMVDGKRYVVAVNGSYDKLSVKIKVNGKSAEELSGSPRTIRAKDGFIPDSFQPFDVHIYRINE